VNNRQGKYILCFYTGNYKSFYAFTLVSVAGRTPVRSLPDSCNRKKTKKKSVYKGSSAFEVTRQVPMAHNYPAGKSFKGGTGIEGPSAATLL
jgi:hypothetical protein